MKTLGIIGGMSYESTAFYYQTLNQLVNNRLGKNHSAKTVVFSVDFEDIVQQQKSGDWQQAGELLNHAALSLERAGADVLVLATNTMHKVSEPMMENVTLPLIHIVEATAKRIQAAGITKVGLLGTSYTMTDSLYPDILANYGIAILTPPDDVQAEINRIIFEELCLGKFSDAAKTYYVDAMKSLNTQGADGMILGCTEIGLLVQQADTDIPLFDTAQIHIEAAVEAMLN